MPGGIELARRGVERGETEAIVVAKSLTGVAGENSVTLPQPDGKPLPPGRYSASMTARDSRGRSTKSVFTFRL